ncbi:hypothetical protein GCM10009007_21090 [Formosimonas limnophila]|uniref:Uncharacterized protein n=1 Tax=Formosimonas limnophila TaxID=1384487 RepID=A0A8J3CIW4_9BURK|nr:hypothetical protein GCM10009007_21090 [Formosimonas limnophila]
MINEWQKITVPQDPNFESYEKIVDNISARIWFSQMGMWCASFTNINTQRRLRADISHCKTAEEAKAAADGSVSV